ncbi:MAG: hypothetical protein BGO54_19515 [Sphingobacteriales bacterium 46-32]|nr:MAG: hypothetical protein BGO54_19515 [Sphingobacteriales bacterium 46-32]
MLPASTSNGNINCRLPRSGYAEVYPYCYFYSSGYCHRQKDTDGVQQQDSCFASASSVLAPYLPGTKIRITIRYQSKKIIQAPKNLS